MRQNKYIALIGQIGSGKSTVLSIIKNNGYRTISSDDITSTLWNNADFIELLKNNFPKAIVNGEISRTTLANLVFNNADELAKLNNLTHPIIKDSIFDVEYQNEIVFVELTAPDFLEEFDEIWSVVTDKEITIDRIIKRNGWDIDTINARIISQQKYNDLINRAQVILHNSSDIISLENIVVEELKSLKIRLAK